MIQLTDNKGNAIYIREDLIQLVTEVQFPQVLPNTKPHTKSIVTVEVNSENTLHSTALYVKENADYIVAILEGRPRFSVGDVVICKKCETPEPITIIDIDFDNKRYIVSDPDGDTLTVIRFEKEHNFKFYGGV